MANMKIESIVAILLMIMGAALTYYSSMPANVIGSMLVFFAGILGYTASLDYND